MSNIELLEKNSSSRTASTRHCNGKLQRTRTKVNDYIVSFIENTINEVSESSLYVTISQTTIS